MADMTRRVVLELLARNRAAGEMASFNRGLDGVRSGAKRLAGSLLALAGVGGGIYMLQRGIRGAIAAGLEQEKVERQLSAAIGGSIVEMKRYAAEMQKQTIYGDELILSQMAYGKNLGITTKQLTAATTAAIGLAAKYRLELNSAMMLVGRAALGQTQMLTRYGIVLDETLDPQEKFNALLKIGADNFYLAQSETKTAAGAMAQFKNNVGDIGEEISMSVLPALTDMLTAVNENKDAWTEFFKVQISGWAEVLSGFESFRTIIDETSKRMVDKGLVPAKQRYGMWAPMPQIEEAKKITSEPGFTYPAGTPMGRLDISPRGYQRLSEMRNRVREMELETAKSAGAEGWTVEPAPAWFDPTDEIQKQLEKEYQIRLAASIKIEDKIAKMTLSTHDYKLRLLEEEIDKYREAGVQEVTIAEFRNERIKELAEELAKSAKDANQDIMKAAQGQVDFVRDLEGISVRERIQNLSDYVEANAEALEAVKEAHQILYDEIERLREVDKTNWDRYWDDLTFHMENFYHNVGDKLGTFAAESQGHLSDALFDYFTEAKSWKEAMEALWDDVLRSFIRMCARMIAEAIMFATLKAALGIGGPVGSIAGLFAGGGGGGLPQVGTVTPQAGAAGAAYASYQHGGIVQETGLALMHKGEEVTPDGGGGVTVNITNNANVDVEVDESTDQRTINLVINAMQTHGPMRRAVSSVRR